MAPFKDAVYATLLMTDSYLPGAMVLGHSLRETGARKAKLAAFVTLESISKSTIDELKTVYDEVVPVNRIVNKVPANLYLMNRPDLISTFTKIELWRQTQFRRIVYIDADVVCLRAPNELLQLDTEFAAVPDIGWPDCFNSGLLVLNPNMGDYYSLLALAHRGISFDGADQGLLNMHFRDWERLSFVYNCTPSGNYQYVPAYRHFQSSISLVHYIGQDKPWILGRDTKHTGVYDELLGRWWSVYDKHYRASSKSYHSAQTYETPRTVQTYVTGENIPALYGYSSAAPPPGPVPVIEVHEPSEPLPVDESMSEQPELIEAIQHGTVEPTPTVEQRQFSAPLAEWNAAQAPPPVDSKPEAVNFPTTTYQMSEDTKLFQPPEKYPEPPKDMYYEIPASRAPPQKPPPIFPWEQHAPKPTRVFVEEKQPEPEVILAPPSATDDESRASEESPQTPAAAGPEPDAWSSYNLSNAWDDNPDIERYVEAFQQARKGKVQVLQQAAQGAEVQTRRSSMKLTDFPTEIERPSLPVTPAPIRRPSFWGEERDSLGDLPAAEGVPKQEDWVSAIESFLSQLTWRCQYCGKQNPVAKLEELQRRQSEVLEKGPQLSPKDIPERAMPESLSTATAPGPEVKPAAPTFTEPTFGESSSIVPEAEKEEVAPEEVEASAPR